MRRSILALLYGLALSCLPAPAQTSGARVRITVEVEGAGVEFRDKPVEVELDLAHIQKDLGNDGAIDESGVRVAEVDKQGAVIDASVPFQLERVEAPAGVRGTLIFILKGSTAAKTTRYYRVLIEADAGRAAPAAAASPALVSVQDNVPHKGQASLRIQTPSATYYYHKEGAGFATMEDQQGNDWIGFQPSGGSAGSYRGIPNAVNPEGCFHPGSTNCTTTLVSGGPLRVRIFSESKDKTWACTWDLYPCYARFTLLRKDHPYWFLYEGTPGGKFDATTGYCVRSAGERTPSSQAWKGDLPAPEWVYFGDRKTNRVLYLVHHEDDMFIDSYWPMENNMTVFGFGRDGMSKFLTAVPQHFTIGFCEESAQAAVSKTLSGAYQDLAVKVGPPSRDGR